MSKTSLGMISNLFPRGADGSSPQPKSGSSSQPSLPRNVKEAVSQCRAAVQEALKKRISRVEIEFPVGTKFGVEKIPKTKSRRGRKRGRSGGGDDGDEGNDPESSDRPTQADLDRSDRELARLFVDMFQPVGGDRITVVFNDMDGADAAKRQWKSDPTAVSRIVSLDRRQLPTQAGGKSASSAASKKKKKLKSRGFAAKLAAEVEDDGSVDGASTSGPFQLPKETEVALFVAPGPKELVIAERICNQVGMGTLVVLLNARLDRLHGKFGSEASRKLFEEEFESVYVLTAAPKRPDQSGDATTATGLLYRAYPKDWILARKPPVGPPKIILDPQDKRPTAEQCQTALEALELSDVEKGVENVMENVAGWFR